MNKCIIVSICVVFVTAQVYTTTPCKCRQLLTQEDCTNSKLNCSWDHGCQEDNQGPPSSNPQNINTYCNSNSISCQILYPCAYVNGACTFFTDCTAFKKQSYEECQNISKRCITNGTHCVQFTTCSSISSYVSCKKNSKGDYCYWDQQYHVCRDAKTCDELPTNFYSDDLCKAAIETCISKKNGGCRPTKTMTKCIDYQSKDQCEDYDCYWIDSNCVDKICINAPSNFYSNSQCSYFLSSCITTSNGGCVTNTSCASATKKEACVSNALGVPCNWENSTWYNGVWSGICYEKTCANAPSSTYTNSDCESYLPKNNCITKKGGGCVTNTSCAAINTQVACGVDVNGQICIWNTANSTCADKTCANTLTAQYDDASCQSFLNTCTVNQTSDGCVNRTCENLLTSAICTYDLNKHPCIYKALCYKKQCHTAPKTLKTHLDCQNYLPSCTVNSFGAGCTSIPIVCSANKTSEACFLKRIVNTSTGAVTYESCGWDGIRCIDKICTMIDKTVITTKDCGTALPGCVSANPVDGIVSGCMDLPETCSARWSSDNCAIAKNGYPTCLWNTKTLSCVEKTCAIATVTGTPGMITKVDASQCLSFSPFCLISNDGKACIERVASCQMLTISQNCIDYAKENNQSCFWNGTQCVDKICSNINLTNHTDCNQKINTCTVNSTLTECMNLTTCNSYTIQAQCVMNASNYRCWWNEVSQTCQDLTCADIDQSKSHIECRNYSTSQGMCTARVSDGVQIDGCQLAGSCSSLVLKNQCFVNISGNICAWNTNVTPNVCQEMSCQTADKLQYTTHFQCQQYLFYSCTLAVTISNGILTAGGCQSLSACSTYLNADQCQIDDQGNQCAWKGSICANKSCNTAPSTTDYSSDKQCRNYLTGCTVASTGKGCTVLTDCESYQSQAQCVTNLKGALCFWVTSANICITKTCENAPSDITDAAGCNNYLAGCTMDSIKCKTAVCEDFEFTTDELCSRALSTCTSNGINCITRGNCSEAFYEASCVSSSDGQLCQWIVDSSTSFAYCSIRTCLTAPIDLKTESACAAYHNGCTTKKGGGCMLRSTCSNLDFPDACNYDSDGNPCQWDITSNSCRNKICSDYGGTTYQECQRISPQCTVGPNKYCATLTTCASIRAQNECIVGTDGPCLWISGYTYYDGSKGACFQYDSCSSLTWTTHSECNLISSNCTTNGINCIGITLCSETNVNGGCVEGTDGKCVQLINESTKNFVCQLFQSCNQAKYKTHSECFKFNSQCTTDGSSGCIELAECQDYSQPGCLFNKEGVIVKNGLIQSTGLCTWDTQANACRDQKCSDLTGTNHKSCQFQLQDCTSNGNACMKMNSCSTYQTQITCFIALGTDGICFWDATISTPSCRLMICQDVKNGITTEICSSVLPGCISDGTQCITKSNCSSYLTKKACNTGGTDGICVFNESSSNSTNGTCGLMTNCSMASSDQVACTFAKDRCTWASATASNGTLTTSCTSHTCQSYQSTQAVCQNFLNWNHSFQQICLLIEGTCTAVDPITLPQTKCHIVSSYTYTWDPVSSKCAVCKDIVNNTNNTNQTNTTASYNTHGYIILPITIILNLIMF